MDTNELTAKYICDDDHKERLQMALHVYQAMPTVREHLIEGIFKAVGKDVAEKMNLDDDNVECLAKSVYFYTQDTGEFYIFAALKDSRGTLSLVAGVYADEKSTNKAQRDEVLQLFRDKCDLDTWSYGESHSSITDVAYAYVHHDHVVARWDRDTFLSQAIRNHDEVVVAVAELLVRIYQGMFASQ